MILMTWMTWEKPHLTKWKSPSRSGKVIVTSGRELESVRGMVPIWQNFIIKNLNCPDSQKTGDYSTKLGFRWI